VVDIWGNTNYRARLYDAVGVQVGPDRDNLQIPGGTGLAIPSLVDGEFLTNDGSVLEWGAVAQVPDPTGSSGKILGNDGVNFIWQAPPTVPDLPIVNTSSSVKIGTMLIQTGTGTAAASGTHTTTAAITFGTAYTSLMGVFVTPGSTNITSSGFNPIPALAASSNTGFTAQFDINEASGSLSIVNSVGFDWVAFGTVSA
jgi:hypothetical protein